ncbi:MAG: ABC transporter ATP-binding protein [Desulfobacterales bacterium]|uniref:ABC transporter ATP-binding protein n=1 Tax=Candidatus Desulfatibia profunda TaxID=2841695 RepID=A0A8J6TNS4_9BACT|nr:ABC transporter ATP-binding protein [Candidatus Desulfatibia profunda]MBL7179327.1 ABC transporter ATP-binding protein [Desulfobacterales bacterium]
MLQIEGLRSSYGSIPVLKGVSIRIPKGEIISIIGANGAGKSTLLKTISGLVKVRKGRIIYKGLDITGMPADRIVGLGISQVPEGRQIFGHLTVLDNIHLGAYLYFKRRNRFEINERIQHVYRIFPILQKRSKQIAGTLSGGEQQMLAIARALMGRPELLLLDEPSMGIAPLVVREIFNVINNLNDSGTTILLVEQNARAALKVAHHSYVLERGEVVLEGLAEELLDNPKVKEVYLGG